MKPATLVATLFLSAIAVLHVIRLVFQVEIDVNGAVIPMWASVVATLAVGALALWLWREQRQ